MPAPKGSKALRVPPPTTARRLAVAAQRLSDPVPSSTTTDDVLQLIRRLGCLQLDPISVVARSHLLVLWSRLGAFDRGLLHTLLWHERRLFEYWAHAASIVLTEDYPIHRYRMRRYPAHEQVHAWMEENRALRRHILRRLRAEGALRSRDLEDLSVRGWRSTGWTGGRNVDRMLGFLWMQGRILVAGRDGLQKVWDLSERVLPPWTPKAPLSDRALVRTTAQRSLRALGVATPRHISLHFVAGRYPGLDGRLGALERDGTIERVQVYDGDVEWPGTWFVHTEDLPLLESIESDGWEPRTTLLSPFDNLIRDRDRTTNMFDFDFRMEIYVPAAQRRYGYYVLSILHGDRLIGRVDPAMDRKLGRLTIRAVHAEPGAPMTARAGRSVRASLEDLATFLGAADIEFAGPVPDGWRRPLRA
jgi:uncharacterized protein